jgi:hypothetical protein
MAVSYVIYSRNSEIIGVQSIDTVIIPIIIATYPRPKCQGSIIASPSIYCDLSLYIEFSDDFVVSALGWNRG